MTQIKILGGLLLLLAGGMAAFGIVRLERKRLSVLDAWLELLGYVRGQIDCFLTPLDEILKSADKALLDACGYSGKEPLTLAVLWKDSAPYPDAECRRLLASLVRELGAGYKEEQLKRCDYYIDSLRRQRDKMAVELPVKLKMGVTVCLCCAIGTAILLW